MTVIWDTTANAILQRLTFSSGRIASIHWLQRSHFIGILPEGLVVFWRVSEEKASKEIRFFLRKDHVHVALQRHSSPSSDGILQLISSVVETGNPGIRRVKNPFCSVDVCLSDTKASISSGIVARCVRCHISFWNRPVPKILVLLLQGSFTVRSTVENGQWHFSADSENAFRHPVCVFLSRWH